jgi:DNA-binding transcriptional ArsR family regulator
MTDKKNTPIVQMGANVESSGGPFSVHDRNTPRTETQAPDMGRAALWYAGQGVAVFPVHEPMFNHPLGYTCTCEEWRHGDWAKKNTPHRYLEPGQHCDGPGKCPRGKWKDISTTDTDTIRRMWRKHPTANIGIDCGKSGLLILDADTYKDSFEGDRLLTQSDEETVTTLTGGGGVHLWYKMPEGKEWGNHNKTLPAGIDIRGAGGYVVAAPSLHKSGYRYAFESGYELGTIDLRPVPDKLAGLLDRAAASSPSRAGVTVHFTTPTTPTTDWPDLAGLNLSPKTLHTIYHPPAVGNRSEADYSVCLALCYAGATDTDILAVFQHYPVGVCGKFYDRGLDYLERTVTSARAWVAQNPRPEQVRAMIPALREWVKTTSFAEFVPADLQSATGYRTDGTDTKIADALLDVCEERGSFRAILSPRDLAQRAGLGSHHTANKALDRLAGWFVDRAGEGMISVARRLPILSHKGGEDKMGNLRATYSARKADDVFLTGRSKPAKSLGNEEPGLGETILRIVDALEGLGTATRYELAQRTGKTLSAIGRACRRAEELGLLDAEREGCGAKEYSLLDWEKRVEELRPTLKTHLLGVERMDRTWEGRQRWADKQLDEEKYPDLTEEDRERLTRSRGRAVGHRLAIGPILRPEMTPDEQTRYVCAPIPGSKASKAALDERRTGEYERLMMQANGLLETAKEAGGVFRKSELATYRTVIGRLGMDVSQTVASVELWG